MNLSAAGLSKTEALCYKALLSRASWQPSQLAKSVNISRTNMYKILDKLASFGLVEKYDYNKKLHYRANNPSKLLELARDRKRKQKLAEEDLESNAHLLMQDFIKTHEQPGIRYYQGKEEITEIFENIAKAKQEVVFIHTSAGIDEFGFDTMHELRMLAVRAGVPRRALTLDQPLAAKDFRIADKKVLLKRTWFAENEYTAPVEWGAYDNTVYILTHGLESFGVTIESTQIANAFRQLFNLVESNQRAKPDYYKLPLLASKLAVTD